MLRAVFPAMIAAALLATMPKGVEPTAAPTVRVEPVLLEAQRTALLSLGDLRDGDVAMVAGDTLASRFVLSISGPEARYSHCGLIVADAGRAEGWSLIHAAPPNEATGDTGVTESVSLSAFVSRPSVRCVDVYRHESASTGASAAIAARGYAAAALPFDGAFDHATGDRLYCSELIWRAYLDAGSPCLLGGRFDVLDSPFAPERGILPVSIAESKQLRRVGVLMVPDPARARAQAPDERYRR